MSWFRRWTTSITELRDPRPSQFAGFADDDPYLYEFTTDDGLVVNLHDGFFEGFRYEVGAPPTVLFTFVFGEAAIDSQDQASPAAVSNARITLRFDDAYVLSWESFQEMPHYRGDGTVPHGEVHEFYRYVGRCFGLQTIDDEIYVEATRVSVAIEPLSADAAASILAAIGGARQ